MRVRISEQTRPTLRDIIDEAQADCGTNLVTTDDLFACLREAEDVLSSVLYKHRWGGIRLELNPAYRPKASSNDESTHFEIERVRGAGWALTYIWRDSLRNRRITWPNASAFTEEILASVEGGCLWGQK